MKAKGLLGKRIRKVTLNGGFTCPNIDGAKARGGCTYCDNRSFSPVAGSRGKSITSQLKEGTEFLRSHLRSDGFIAYFQTFSGTYAPTARLRSLYEEALAFPDVVGLAIGTRPDCITPQTADLLQELSRRTFVTLELGLQSAFDESLQRINRAHLFAEFAATMDLCRGRGFDICVHVILGLPGEGRLHFQETAAALGRWPIESVKIHPLHVVKGTALAREFARGEYCPMEMEEYVAGLVDFLERMPPETAVQRFTGDAGADLLLAPLWCTRKSAILEAMKAEFLRRGTCQGWRLSRGRLAAKERSEAPDMVQVVG